MHSAPLGSWTVRLGRWRGVEARLHILFPLVALAVLFVASLPHDFDLVLTPFTSTAACLGLAALFLSIAGHEAVKCGVARRVGGRTPLVVLAPWGSGAQPQLPADPPAHLVTALAGPLAFLAIAVAAGCGLALLGDRDLLEVIRPFDPRLVDPTSQFQLAPAHLFLRQIVWINGWLLLINMLPVAPFDGAEVLRGFLWPLVGRASAAAAAAHVAYGASVVTAVMAIAVHRQLVNDFLPAAFPLAVTAVLLFFGGNRAARQSQSDAGLDIDELESDDEQWLSAEWLEEERAAVLVERIEEKQQAALDRKRREREDREDARVDDILARIQEVGFEQLSEEDRAILKRASRRYRQRREREPDSATDQV